MTNSGEPVVFQPYEGQHGGHPWLKQGDQVVVASRRGAFTGTVIERLRKNFRITDNATGKTWRVPPGLIRSYSPTTTLFPSIPPSLPPKSVTVQRGTISDCQVGDVILMFRGKFDVVRIKNVDTLLCTVLPNGKDYRYKPNMMVQKLDKSLFSS